MRFEEALVHLRAGKRIRCKLWSNKFAYFGYKESENHVEYEASINEILYSDWELFEESENNHQGEIELPTEETKDYDIRLNNLEAMNICKRLLNIENRLSELEQWTRAEEYRVNNILKIINVRLTNIENKQDNIESNIKIMKDNLQDQCFSCKGKGVILNESKIVQSICNSCDGTGALWK